MCIRSHSESGQPCGFEPCAAYINLLSEKSRLEGRCAGLEDGNQRNLESMKRQDAQMVEILAENERLRQELDTLQIGYKAAKSSRRLAIVERDALRPVVERADALAEHQIRECEGCNHPCSAYGLARVYQEARHG
jgi:hypothetical protein